jgi:hypothetical protein
VVEHVVSMFNPQHQNKPNKNSLNTQVSFVLTIVYFSTCTLRST